MVTEKAIKLVEQQEWLEKAEEAVQDAVGSAFRAGGATGKKVMDALHGTWAGHPLHPIITDVPIGAWTTALVLDAADAVSGGEEFSGAADVAVTLGLVGAVGSAVTGLTDWHHTQDAPRRIGFVHAALNITATTLYAASLIARKRESRGLGRTLAFIGYAVAGLGAFLGGELVYGKQIGVDHTANLELPQKFTPVLKSEDLLDNTMVRVDLDKTSILLVRQNGKVHAMVETCSHLGGPLCEGTLEDGSVVCPWHGSRFALADGSLIEGPSTFRQPSLETRMRSGWIELRNHG